MPGPRERDLERTREDLAAWLAARLPAARDLAVGPLEGPGTTGFSSDTLLFEARWRDGAGGERREALVARLEPRGFGIFPEYDVARQFRIQRALAEADTGVPVAPMRWLETDPRFLGVPFYVMGRVEGRIPTDNPPYHAGGWLTEVAPAEREALWWSGLEVLARIHRLDWRALGLDGLEQSGAESAAAALDAQLAYWERYVDWLGGPAVGLLRPVLERLRAEHPRPEGPPALSWGDARIGNMIFREGRCQAVLDWEMVGLAPPELDLGWWLFLDHHHSAGVGVPRLPGFPDRAATVARYEALLGRPVRDLPWYELFAALRFSAVMARVGQQLRHYGLLPADSDFETNNTCSRLLETLLEPTAPRGQEHEGERSHERGHERGTFFKTGREGQS